MSVFQSIILGLVQGITEFLPVSSSGHLTVLQSIFGLEEVPLLYDILLHVSTLLVVFVIFRKTIFRLIGVFFRFCIGKKKPEDGESLKMIWAVLAATLVTGIMGLLASKYLMNDYPIKIVGAGFIVTAILLFLTNFKKDPLPVENQEKGAVLKKSPSIIQGLITGFAQGIGVLPGISRSGSTISAALYSGVDREVAGEFSFILSIPAILGALILELKDADNMLQEISALSLAAGIISAFISGFVALKFLLYLIKKGRLFYFAFYLVPLGIYTILFL